MKISYVKLGTEVGDGLNKRDEEGLSICYVELTKNLGRSLCSV